MQLKKGPYTRASRNRHLFFIFPQVLFIHLMIASSIFSDSSRSISTESPDAEGTTVASVPQSNSITAGAVVAIVLVLLVLTVCTIAAILGTIIVWQKRKSSSQAMDKTQYNTGKGIGKSFNLIISFITQNV